nr:PriCT-2 domain-containing protein [Bradyrhizobium sp. sGM-13]
MVREKEGCRFPDTPKDRLAEKVFNDSWSTERVASLATLTKTHRDGYNLGVRLGEPSLFNDLYLHCIDLDIRDPDKADEAWGALLELIPEARSLPSVISGSMGESRHLYFLTDRPFPSKKLRHSTEKIIGKDKKAHWAWEIERFGTGKQVVVPPSIHPDTGKRYKWEREWPVDLVELGVGPVIPASRVAGWEPPSRDETDVRTNALGLSVAEAKDILADLPTDTWREDRDGWLQVGMALHHEFNGSKEGFKAWVEFSAASDKYDPEDQRRVWRSFRQSNKPVRMATLLSAAKEVRLMSAFDDLGDEDEIDGDDARVKPGHMDDDVDDLLGEGDDTATEQPERVRKLKQAEVHHELGHVPKRIAKLNKNHAVAFVKGKTVILTFEKDGTTSYGSVHDVYNYYENDRVATEKSTEPVTKAWMRHKARRSYPNGIVFAPQGGPDGAYNHWQGFAVEPDPSSSCARFLDHLRDNICAGDDNAYQWVIRWFAHMVQRPWEKPGTALVLKGRKGAGKDTIGDYVGGLFPHHHNFEPRTSGRPLQRASGKDPAAACRRRLLGRRQKGRRATEAPDHVRTGDDREQRHQRISSRVGAPHHNQFERRLDRAVDIRRAALLRAQRRRYQGARHRLLRQAARGSAPRRSRRAAAPPARRRFDRLRRAQPADDHRRARSENRLAPRHRAMAFRDPVLRPRARGFDVRGRRALLGRRLDQGRGRRFPSQLRGLVKATPVCRRSAQRFTVRRACAPNLSSDHPHSPQGRR